MPIITKPVSVNVFDKMWISKAMFHFVRNGYIAATFNPYDGKNILSNKAVTKFISNFSEVGAQDPDFETMMTALVAECKRQANKQLDISVIVVSAPNPSAKINATIVFNKTEGGVEEYRIKDCYALVASDPIFAGVFQNTMIQLAKQAGFEYED
jgi:hypothetical protein